MSSMTRDYHKVTAALNAMFLKLRPTDAPGALRISGWEMLIYRSGPEAQNDRVREVQGGCYQRGKADSFRLAHTCLRHS